MLTATKLAALHLALEQFDSATLDRGFEYFNSERISDIEIRKTLLNGLADGTSIYEVYWRFARGGWHTECSCPVGFRCKHAAALAMSVLARLESPSADSSSAPESFEGLEADLQRVLKRAIKKPERKQIRALIVLHAELQKRPENTVYDDELARVGIRTGRTEPRWISGPAIKNCWVEPPATPVDLWQYLAHYAERHDLIIPPVFRPITDTSRVRASIEKHLLEASIAEWESTLADFVPPIGPTAANRSLRLRLRFELPRLRWEASAGSDQWAALGAQEARSLAEDRPVDTTNITDPATILLLEFARRIHSPSGFQRSNYALSLDRKEDAALLGAVLRTPLGRTAVVNRSGQPVVIAEQSLHWNFVPSIDLPEEQLTATLTDSAGEPVSVATVLPGDPSLLVIGETIHPLPPPLDPASLRPYAPTQIPREALKRNPRAVAALSATGATLPAELVPRVRRITPRPRMEFELAGRTDARNLQVRLLAESEESVLVWTGRNGWLCEGKNPPANDPDGTVRDYDTSSADELIDHLAALGLGYFDHAGCWGRPFTRKAADRLLDWAQALPPGIDILATAELAQFFAPVVRVKAEFHIEERPNSPDWFDLRVQLAAGEIELTPAELKELARSGGKLVQLKSGRWLRAEFSIDPALEEVARRLGFGSVDAIGGETLTCHALQLAAQPLEPILDGNRIAQLRRRADELTAHPPPPLPPDLVAELRPYQRDGFAFMAFLSSNGFGGILADDMGLGKTIQALAWLLWLRSRQENPAAFRVLVVCPKSVVFNWHAEGGRFAPTLPVRAFLPADTEADAGAGLTIANYAQLRINAEWFTGRTWDAVILDEGQNIKNPTATTTRTACLLRADHRLILTGTPVENRALDL